MENEACIDVLPLKMVKMVMVHSCILKYQSHQRVYTRVLEKH